jgi:hypothetical protein
MSVDETLMRTFQVPGQHLHACVWEGRVWHGRCLWLCCLKYTAGSAQTLVAQNGQGYGWTCAAPACMQYDPA